VVLQTFVVSSPIVFTIHLDLWDATISGDDRKLLSCGRLVLFPEAIQSAISFSPIPTWPIPTWNCVADFQAGLVAHFVGLDCNPA